MLSTAPLSSVRSSTLSSPGAGFPSGSWSCIASQYRSPCRAVSSLVRALRWFTSSLTVLFASDTLVIGGVPLHTLVIRMLLLHHSFLLPKDMAGGRSEAWRGRG